MFSTVRFISDLRPQGHDASDVGIEDRSDRENGPLFGRFGAEDSKPFDAHGAGGQQPHWLPDPAGVPVWMDAIPMLKDAGEVPFRGAGLLRAARHFDGQGMLCAGSELIGDLEQMRGEVPLGIAEVGAVQGNVALIEDSVKLQPPSPARRTGMPRRLKMTSINDWAVLVCERRFGSPMMGNRHRFPSAVVEIRKRGSPP